MSDLPDQPDGDAEHDPYLLTLGQIAAELSAIRRVLQEQNDERPATDTELETYDCRHCDMVLDGKPVARSHAVDGHNAPASDWRMVYE